MGMDLSMVRTPGLYDIPSDYPKELRKYPGYFRGVPRDALEEAGVFDHSTKVPRGPGWPPRGLAEQRARQLLELFDTQTGMLDPVPSLEELKPTFRELRIIQRHVDAANRVLSAVSKRPGKVPSFKFRSNDAWRVVPEECLVIAHRLTVYLREREPTGAPAVDTGEKMMRLTAPDAEDIVRPSPDQVVAAIEALDHQRQNPYFILNDASRPNAFMQTLKASPRLFVVEYAEGKPQRQYAARKIPKRQVKDLFLSYLKRDASFKSSAEWEEITDEFFGAARHEREWIRRFIAFNELAAKFGGYEVC